MYAKHTQRHDNSFQKASNFICHEKRILATNSLHCFLPISSNCLREVNKFPTGNQIFKKFPSSDKISNTLINNISYHLHFDRVKEL